MNASDYQSENRCANCGKTFTVCWWSNASKKIALEIAVCPACEVKLHPSGTLALLLKVKQDT
jgi:DNA-directed RNA polymerase subunit RPC12/RpoP